MRLASTGPAFARLFADRVACQEESRILGTRRAPLILADVRGPPSRVVDDLHMRLAIRMQSVPPTLEEALEARVMLDWNPPREVGVGVRLRVLDEADIAGALSHRQLVEAPFHERAINSAVHPGDLDLDLTKAKPAIRWVPNQSDGVCRFGANDGVDPSLLALQSLGIDPLRLERQGLSSLGVEGID